MLHHPPNTIYVCLFNLVKVFFFCFGGEWWVVTKANALTLLLKGRWKMKMAHPKVQVRDSTSCGCWVLSFFLLFGPCSLLLSLSNGQLGTSTVTSILPLSTISMSWYVWIYSWSSICVFDSVFLQNWSWNHVIHVEMFLFG